MAELAGRADSAITPEVEELIMKMSDAGISYRVIADRIGLAHSTVSNRITQIRQRRKQAESGMAAGKRELVRCLGGCGEMFQSETAALTGSAIGANSGIGNTRAEWPRTFSSMVIDLMDGDEGSIAAALHRAHESEVALQNATDVMRYANSVVADCL